MHGQPHNTIGNRIGIGSDRSGRCGSRSPSLCVVRCRRYPLHQYSFSKPLSILDQEVERLKTGGGLVGWRAGWLDGLGLEGPQGWELAGGAGAGRARGWKKVAKARTCSVPFHQRGLEGWTVGGLRAGGAGGLGGLAGWRAWESSGEEKHK